MRKRKNRRLRLSKRERIEILTKIVIRIVIELIIRACQFFF